MVAAVAAAVVAVVVAAMVAAVVVAAVALLPWEALWVDVGFREGEGYTAVLAV